MSDKIVKEQYYFDTDRVYLRALLDPATMRWVDVAGDPELEAEVEARRRAATAIDPDWWRAKGIPDAAEIVEETS